VPITAEINSTHGEPMISKAGLAGETRMTAPTDFHNSVDCSQAQGAYQAHMGRQATGHYWHMCLNATAIRSRVHNASVPGPLILPMLAAQYP
jgi:hypothetical protein